MVNSSKKITQTRILVEWWKSIENQGLDFQHSIFPLNTYKKHYYSLGCEDIDKK